MALYGSSPMPTLDSPEVFRFLDFELDVSAYQLRHEGRPVRLERQPMDLLILLVQRRSQLVSREEIVERLWGKDVFVDVETGVHTAIRKIRQALRDSSDAPTCVETVTGKGYRFIAPVEIVPRRKAGAPAPAPVPDAHAPAVVHLRLALVPFGHPRRSARLRGPGRGSAAARPRSRVTVAVLPFDNMSGDVDRQYLADGLAEETIASFGQLDPERLGVIGRTSTAAYKGTRKSLAEIGRELGADYLVEGSIRADGGQVRITSRLVRARDQTQVWSASFDREPTSIVALQRELSTAIASQIHLRLSPERLGALAPEAHADAEAYDLYLRGRFFWRTSAPRRRTSARSSTTSARSPSTPTTRWRGRGSPTCWWPARSTATSPRRTVAARVREAAARAVRAAPDLPEAHRVRGMVAFWLDWDWPAAESAFRRAIALDPGDAARAPHARARPLADRPPRRGDAVPARVRVSWSRSSR